MPTSDYDNELLLYIQRHRNITFPELCNVRSFSDKRVLAARIEFLDKYGYIEAVFTYGDLTASGFVPSDKPIILTSEGERVAADFKKKRFKNCSLELRSWIAFFLSIAAFLWQILENFLF